ncbi:MULTISPECIES: hypothetical protein [Actinomyces]|nr:MULTISPECIES: hypothetical protein [Actinomyces]
MTKAKAAALAESDEEAVETSLPADTDPLPALPEADADRSSSLES